LTVGKGFLTVRLGGLFFLLQGSGSAAIVSGIKKRIPMKYKLLLICMSVSAVLVADEIQIQDGTVLKGTIASISETVIELETGFAGTLKVDRAQVSGFTTDNPVFVRLASGAVMPGTVSQGEAGTVTLTGVDGVLSAPLASVRQGWVQADKDPEMIAREQAAAELERKWKYQVSANASAKSGNTDEQSIGAKFSATLDGKHDELKFYGSYDSKETDGEKSSDERKLGMRYTSYFNDPWGWYARQEIEIDEFENIALRSVTAAGISRRFAHKDHYKLSANAGFSYRYESYEDGTEDAGIIGLDVGLQHYYRFRNNFEMNNELTWVPSIEDFGSYLITQDSWLDFPLGGSDVWKVRLGLKNDYNSMPEGDREELDTTWYSSVVIDWE
jgi:putative salt-induced outer membrane protein YdiY